MSQTLAYRALLALLLLLYCRYVDAFEYCNTRLGKELCASSVHFMCTAFPYRSGPEFVMHVPNTPKIIRRVLHKHNIIRNATAGGSIKVPMLPQASRMREVNWDNELALLAMRLSARCFLEQDACAETIFIGRVGLNIIQVASGTQKRVLDLIDMAFKQWHPTELTTRDGYGFAQNYTDCCGGAHIALILNDLVNRVGCSFSYCKHCEGLHCYYLACAYDYQNLVGHPVYKIREESALDCSPLGGRSINYENLCIPLKEDVRIYQRKD